jgi:hypothetical protein
LLHEVLCHELAHVVVYRRYQRVPVHMALSGRPWCAPLGTPLPRPWIPPAANTRVRKLLMGSLPLSPPMQFGS